MPAMTDPNDALVSFQEHLPVLLPHLQRGTIHRDVYVYVDEVNGVTRFTYTALRDGVVVAIAIFAMDAPADGWMNFNLGYAVAEPFRHQGHAKTIVKAGLDEMTQGFGRTPIKGFIVNAVVGEDNLASQQVAAATIAVEPDRVVDAYSGLPALHYRGEFSVPMKAG